MGFQYNKHMTTHMTTADHKVVGNCNISFTVTYTHLVKLRSFKNLPVVTVMLSSVDSSQSDQLTAFKSCADNSDICENTLNDCVNRTNRYQELPSHTSSGIVNDNSEAKLVLDNHSIGKCVVYKARSSDATIFHRESMCTFAKNHIPDSETKQLNSSLHAFDWIKQSCSSRQQVTVNNLNVDNNFQTNNSNITQLTRKSCDLQLINSDVTDKEVFQNLSLVQTKQITSATPTQRVHEACKAITRNLVSSATVPETKFLFQESYASSNNVEKHIGDNTRTLFMQKRHKENSGWMEPIDVTERINLGLQMLKSELKALRMADLALLKQLIAISQAIQRMQRANLRSARSMSFVSSARNLQLRYRTMERQFSAPHGASCRRDLLSFRRASTEDSLGDSMHSLDATDSESQNQLAESNSLLSIFYTNPTSLSTSPSKLYPDLVLTYDLSENTDEEYEVILQRNIRLWKIGSQRQELSGDMVLV